MVNADRKDQEVSDGFSIKGNLEYDYLLYEEPNLGSTAGATAVLWYPAILLVPVFLLVSWFPPLASGLPWFFVFCLWCCSESEDSVNLLRIQRSNSLCDLVSLLFFLVH